MASVDAGSSFKKYSTEIGAGSDDARDSVSSSSSGDRTETGQGHLMDASESSPPSPPPPPPRTVASDVARRMDSESSKGKRHGRDSKSEDKKRQTSVKGEVTSKDHNGHRDRDRGSHHYYRHHKSPSKSHLTTRQGDSSSSSSSRHRDGRSGSPERRRRRRDGDRRQSSRSQERHRPPPPPPHSSHSTSDDRMRRRDKESHRSRSRSRSRSRDDRDRHRRSRSRDATRFRKDNKRSSESSDKDLHKDKAADTKQSPAKPTSTGISAMAKTGLPISAPIMNVVAAAAALSKNASVVSAEKAGCNLPLVDPLMMTAGLRTVQPQVALQQSMAAMTARVHQLTGVTLPKYYNPASVNPLKYAEQMQKRKLLWQNKEQTTVVPSTNKWEQTTFSQDQDGKMAAKFKKLMGIKEDALAAATNHSGDSSGESSVAADDHLKKQEELFRTLDQQYEVARISTHTQRGVGLGFSSSAAATLSSMYSLHPK